MWARSVFTANPARFSASCLHLRCFAHLCGKISLKQSGTDTGGNVELSLISRSHPRLVSKCYCILHPSLHNLWYYKYIYKIQSGKIEIFLSLSTINLHCWQDSLQSVCWIKLIPHAAWGMIPHRIGYASLQSAKGHVPMQVSPWPLSSSSDAVWTIPTRSRIVEASLIISNELTQLRREWYWTVLQQKPDADAMCYLTSSLN